MIVLAGSMPSISEIPKSVSSGLSDFHNCAHFWETENAGMTIEWILEGLKKPGKSRSGLAAALGRSPSMVTDMLKPGGRRLKADEVPLVAAYLEVAPPAPGRITSVPLVGHVGAGAAAVLFSDGQGPFDEVDAPDNANDSTVAVEVRGESLGALFDRWLVYYDDVRDPPGGDQIGQLCVCGLADGRILVKKLKRGQVDGTFTLISNVEPPIYDVYVDWAARVKAMQPR